MNNLCRAHPISQLFARWKNLWNDADEISSKKNEVKSAVGNVLRERKVFFLLSTETHTLCEKKKWKKRFRLEK